DQPPRLLAPVRHLPCLRPGREDVARDAPRLPLHRRQAREGRPGRAPAVRQTAGFLRLAACGLLAAAACSPSAAAGKTEKTAEKQKPFGVEVEDAIHGVRYQLPAGADLWQ